MQIFDRYQSNPNENYLSTFGKQQKLESAYPFVTKIPEEQPKQLRTETVCNYCKMMPGTPNNGTMIKVHRGPNKDPFPTPIVHHYENCMIEVNTKQLIEE